MENSEGRHVVENFWGREAGNASASGFVRGALRSFAASNDKERPMSTMIRADGHCLPRECIRVGVSARTRPMVATSAGADAADQYELEVAWP